MRKYLRKAAAVIAPMLLVLGGTVSAPALADWVSVCSRNVCTHCNLEGFCVRCGPDGSCEIKEPVVN
jgi:hypothetical protein